MRSFIAVPIPRHTIEGIWSSCTQLREQYPSVKWVKPEGIHITLAFLGEIDGETCQKIQTALGEINWRTTPFQAWIKELGCFPQKGAPRVLFTHIDRGAGICRKLYRQVKEVVSPIVQLDKKPFKPHITLGRYPRGYAGEAPASDAADINETFIIEKVILYESILSRTGAEYHPIETFYLPEGPDASS